MSVVFMLAIARVCKTWSVPALTAPFVLLTWLLLLATHAFYGLDGGALPPVGEIVPIDPGAADPLRPGDFVAGIFTSISQVFLKGHGPAALLLLAGLAVSSLPCAVFAVAGAAVGVVTAHLLGAESELVTAGLLGFEPGADGDRARRGVPQAGRARRDLRARRGGAVGDRAGGHDGARHALRHPHTDPRPSSS